MTAAATSPVLAYQGISDTDFSEWKSTAQRVADELAATALERDRANQNPIAEIELLRKHGLLSFATAREFGGAGGNLTQALQLSRIIAAADGSIGQLLVYHYSNGVWTYILGSPAQREYVARGVGEHGWFQGSVSNPRDPGITVTRTDEGYRVNGTRTFATGVAIADLITVLLYAEEPINAIIPREREGLRFNDDWDNLGQRLTASGSVEFDNVLLRHDEILTGLGEYGVDRERRDGLRALFSQLIFVHLYLGIAEGALSAAVTYIRKRGRPWPEAHSAEVTEDPYHQQLLGRLSAGIAAGIALADAVTREFEQVLAAGDAPSTARWGALAVRVDQAKSVATEVSLDVTHNIYQATGARSTANSVGLDIYWRNARTHTTHDPLPYRQREIGRYLLTDEWPSPRSLSGLGRLADTTQGKGS
ncbi:monooxygenase [Mycobacterium sp. CBMA271]|uniref:acyl-CoA dehydrogenase family protein n=1 Tax=unclassified Mycobacteroides TaxID=2618759 RepID=UPI0012DCB1D4|nr:MULTISPECIES: acyl-CoA dehydrogenase family protein [unclassified Mycobacteroides]MUM16853.1 monooxygenase [Mycobacteroides sp. CBMA 326]MUM21176.1 monooxygenase [Mycobacteroides sp. CBMA 271]